MTVTQRADARRNYERILAVAEAEVARHGADASLEKIARVAGVGSATVRRHFPGRFALLEAVSREQVSALSTYARSLVEAPDPRRALLLWLREVLDYCIAARGLAAALAYNGAENESLYENSCATILEDAATPLLKRAQKAGVAKDDVEARDLIALVLGFTLATEGQSDRVTTAHHLLQIATEGL